MNGAHVVVILRIEFELFVREKQLQVLVVARHGDVMQRHTATMRTRINVTIGLRQEELQERLVVARRIQVQASPTETIRHRDRGTVLLQELGALDALHPVHRRHALDVNVCHRRSVL